jgi:alcohol dehydrogenase class IV
MRGFTFNTVARVVSGAGEALALGARCNDLGIRHVLLVTDPGLVDIGLVAPVQAALEAAGVGVTRFAEVREDPPESVVEAATAGRARRGCRRCDCRRWRQLHGRGQGGGGAARR